MHIRTEADANSALDSVPESWTRRSIDNERIQRHNQRALTLRWLAIVAVICWAAILVLMLRGCT